MVKAVLIDAMSTIFSFEKGLTKYEILKKFIFELLGEKIPVDRIKEVYDAKRAVLEIKLKVNHLSKWAIINKEILLALFPDTEEAKAEKLGKVISKRMASDSSLYQVSRDTRNFLKEAKKRGIKIIIASNQDPDCLSALTKDFKLLKLLDQIYDSSRVGLEKPDPRFFQIILKEEKLSPEDCVMIGNNPKNDVWTAQKIGMTGVLLDIRNLYPEHQGYRISQFEDFWQLDISKRS